MSKAKKNTQKRDELLTTKEAEAIIGIHHMTLMKHIWDKAIPAHKDDSGIWRLRKSDVLEFKKSRGDTVSKPGRKNGEPSSRSVKNNIRISLDHGKKLAIMAIESETSATKIMEDLIEKAFASDARRKAMVK